MLSSKYLLFIEYKKTRGLTLVFLFLMGDVFTPSDDVFILVEDSFDIVLVTDDNQGGQRSASMHFWKKRLTAMLRK